MTVRQAAVQHDSPPGSGPTDRSVLLHAALLGTLVAFSRPLEEVMLWFHGILLVALSVLTYLNLRSSSDIRMPASAALFIALSAFAVVNGLSRGFGVVPVFRDATPFIAFLCGLLVMNLSAPVALRLVRLHLLIAAWLMAAQVIVRWALVPTESPMDLYFYRASLPLYVSYLPLAALFLWLGGPGNRIAATVLLIAAALTFGRVDYALLALFLLQVVVLSPLARHPLARIVLVLGGVTAVLGGVVFLSQAGGGFARLNVDTSDPSLGWRVIEFGAFLDWWDGASSVAQLVGEGFGSAIRLPGKLLDFAGNPTIPVLHVSPLTWILKFGIVGLLLLLATLVALLFDRSMRRVFGFSATVMLLAVFVLRGLVQHGLYEPWPLFLLGIALGTGLRQFQPAGRAVQGGLAPA